MEFVVLVIAIVLIVTIALTYFALQQMQMEIDDLRHQVRTIRTSRSRD